MTIWAVPLSTMALRCHSLTPMKFIVVFEVYQGLVDLFRPLA